MYPGYVSINDIGDIGDPFPCRDRMCFNKFEVNYIDSCDNTEFFGLGNMVFEVFVMDI